MFKNFVFALTGMILLGLAFYANLEGISAAPQAQPGTCQEEVTLYLDGPTKVSPNGVYTFTTYIVNTGSTTFIGDLGTFFNGLLRNEPTDVVSNPGTTELGKEVTDFYFNPGELVVVQSVFESEECSWSSNTLEVHVEDVLPNCPPGLSVNLIAEEEIPFRGTINYELTLTSSPNYGLKVENVSAGVWSGMWAEILIEDPWVVPGEVLTGTTSLIGVGGPVIITTPWVEAGYPEPYCRTFGESVTTTVVVYQTFLPLIVK